MSAGHLSQRRDGGKAPQITFTRRYRAPVTQVPTAPHQIVWPDWPQLAKAMASPIIWALTPSMAMRRLYTYRKTHMTYL
jgi:hypothetical protein